ncbi:MAG: DNA polymerase III subunit beta, partial [Oscillospiraceae bacterium]|nr:DNA polymerase III subunit beta [Oscillospiraceae bacterium]
MKIICSRNELLTAITGVGRAVSTKSPVPAMEGILFQCEDNSLKLTAYDLELGIITYTPAEIYEPGDIVINARLLGEILRKSEGESVQIETEPNLMVKINSGATRYSFMGLPSTDFPELPV